MNEIYNFLKQTETAPSYYLMDFNWHLYKNFHSFSNLSVPVMGYQKPTGHIYGLFRTVSQIRSIRPTSPIIMCMDGKPVRRNELMGGEYKEGRTKPEYNPKQDTMCILRMLAAIPGLYIARHDELESDDIMFAMSRKITAQRRELESPVDVYIYSGDDDLLQALDENVHILREFTPNLDKLITVASLQKDDKLVQKYCGVEPRSLPYYRAIVGDSSDNINGISRFPHKLAARIAPLLREGTLKDMRAFTTTEQSWLSTLIEQKDLYNRNLQVMRLTSDISFELKPLQLTPELRYKMLAEMRSLQMRKFFEYIGETM